MPALNFKKQFAPAVLNGTKQQTIRAARKHPIKAGDKLYLYTGMRTKQCQRLRVTRCTKVSQIRISCDNYNDVVLVWIDGRALDFASITKLAKRDGFKSVVGFRQFFSQTHGTSFQGQLIEWRG